MLRSRKAGLPAYAGAGHLPGQRACVQVPLRREPQRRPTPRAKPPTRPTARTPSRWPYRAARLALMLPELLLDPVDTKPIPQVHPPDAPKFTVFPLISKCLATVWHALLETIR